MKINEEQFENLVIKWLQELGYFYENGYEIAPGTDRAERADYRQVILIDRLRAKLILLNPHVPATAIEDAINQITRPNFPSLLQSNREFHRQLRDGVKVAFQADDETKADLSALWTLKPSRITNFWQSTNFP